MAANPPPLSRLGTGWGHPEVTPRRSCDICTYTVDLFIYSFIYISVFHLLSLIIFDTNVLVSKATGHLVRASTIMGRNNSRPRLK